VAARCAQALQQQGVALQHLTLVGTAVTRFEVPPVSPPGAPPLAETVLVLHGEQDDVVPLAAVLDWARPQQLPVVVFPGAGHFFHGLLLPLRDWVCRWHRAGPG
jgi:alpha/beta superfamily hydrolase